MSETRQPTIPEALAWLRQCLTAEYRAECIRYWRERYGDEFVRAVGAKMERRK